MIGLGHAKIVRRLGDAIKRHGLLTVVRVVFGALMRHGLGATFRFGAAQRPFPWPKRPPAVVVGQPAGALADLDEAYTLAGQAWSRWSDIIGMAALSVGQVEESVPLLFVLQGQAQAPGDLERTRSAIAALGPGARLWSPGDEGNARFYVFLRPGDSPSPDLPACLARAARGGVAEVISFDLIRRDGDRVQPLLLPGANPTLLQAADYMFSRLAVAPGLVHGQVDLERAPVRDLVLGWMEGRPAHQTRGRWRHIGRPLVEAAISGEAIDQARRQVMEQNRRPPPAYAGAPISVVICTRDKGHLIRQLVRRLLTEEPSLVGEIIIVSNNTTNPHALASLEDLGRSPRIQILRRDEPFNFSKLCNEGVRQGSGRGPLLFLNDDIVPVSEDWLQRLAARLEDPAVGSVGPLLLYPDERVQHAGMYLGYKGGAGHTLRGARLPEEDYLFTGCAPREVSAMTGAALLTRRAAFEALNGFDEQLALAFQDVDYGLRLRAVGLLNVFEPASVLIHMESASVRSLDAGGEVQRKRQAERMRYVHRWEGLLQNDPLHPHGFDVEDETLRRLSGPEGQRPRSR